MRTTTTVIATATLLLAACGPIRSTTTPLAASGRAPGLSLPNQRGEDVTLDDLTANGPTVLVFNRGHH